MGTMDQGYSKHLTSIDSLSQAIIPQALARDRHYYHLSAKETQAYSSGITRGDHTPSAWYGLDSNADSLTPEPSLPSAPRIMTCGFYKIYVFVIKSSRIRETYKEES